jgi:3-dehydroquinate synthase
MPVIKANRYSVHAGRQGFKAISAFLAKHRYSSYFILCDDNTLQHCLPLLILQCPKLSEAQIIETESGEASKSIELCTQIWQTLLENRAGKNTLFINLGGGVISDLGGFSASVYKRGIDFIHIPTSLLAMADASVGGKTAIDFSGIKNSIGTFAQPKAVFVIPEFLSTLPVRHYQNGLVEVFKIALVSDKAFWRELDSGKNTDAQLIAKSIALKNKVVLRDPFDKGLRKILNFGHTIGHAIEGLLLGSPNELLHGEAILAGMLMESHLAFQKKLIGKTVLQEVSSVLKRHFTLPPLSRLPVNDLMDLMANDKKVLGTIPQFALINGIGSCRIDLSVTETQIKKALTYYSTLSA